MLLVPFPKIFLSQTRSKQKHNVVACILTALGGTARFKKKTNNKKLMMIKKQHYKQIIISLADVAARN